MDEVLKVPGVRLSNIQLKNFRCFKQFSVDIDAPYVLFIGENGVGKTSVLEALYYACYLRSFRTSSTKELIAVDHNEFFVKVQLVTPEHQHTSHIIQIGFSPAKRLVKVDQKPVISYKELMAYYRIVSITESDLDIIQGGPHNRRLFIDQVIMLLDSAYPQTLKNYRKVVDQRNALLQQHTMNQESFLILTQQVWRLSSVIEKHRKDLIERLTQKVNQRGEAFIPHFVPLGIAYNPRYIQESSFEKFYTKNKKLIEQEKRYKRTLFGVHLDDLCIAFQKQSARSFASRGQQKLILILIKMAQLELLINKGIPAICLIDDFMTDFDAQKAQFLLRALQDLGTQLIFTTPLKKSPLAEYVMKIGAHSIHL